MKVSLTDHAYRRRDVLRTERVICRQMNFNFYGEEVATFLDRFIAAAFKEGDRKFRVLCMFLLDCVVSTKFLFNHNCSGFKRIFANGQIMSEKLFMSTFISLFIQPSWV